MTKTSTSNLQSKRTTRNEKDDEGEQIGMQQTRLDSGVFIVQEGGCGGQ